MEHSLPELRDKLGDRLGIAWFADRPLRQSHPDHASCRSGPWARTHSAPSEITGHARVHRQALGTEDLRPAGSNLNARQPESGADRGLENPRRLHHPADVSADERQIKQDRHQAKARVFRDPARYEAISTALLDTIYDIHTPEEATQDILQPERQPLMLTAFTNEATTWLGYLHVDPF